MGGAVDRAERGLLDADLGGGVIKQRTVILYRRGNRAFFVYGFAKSAKANLSKEEETQFKEAAKSVLLLTDDQVAELLDRRDFVEVKLK